MSSGQFVFDLRGGQGTPKRAPPDGTCQTCTTCRRRKVKCDGRRPRCKGCDSRNESCEYPSDARKTAIRTKKGDVRSLQRQIEELKEQLREETSRGAGTRRPSSTASYDLNSHTPPGSVAGDGTGALTSSPNNRYVVSTKASNSLRASNSPQTNEYSAHTVLSPSTVLSAPISFVPERSSNNRLYTPEPNSRGEETGADVLPVYGATSMLHGLPSEDSSPKAQNPTKEDRKKVLQERLISFAALRSQEEKILHSSPSITANIDFDGVPPDTALHLMDLHWNRQHFAYLFTYRPAIIDSLVRGGPYLNKLLLNALYLQGSMYSDRLELRSDAHNAQTSGMTFYDRFRALLPEYVEKPTLPTVVALLLAGSCLVPRGKQSAGWLFCGMGYRMIIDLGCHLDVQSHPHSNLGTQLTAIDMEMRRRTYWGAYAVDKLQSLFLGRPQAMPITAGSMALEFLDTYEEMEEWTPYVDPIVQPFDTSVPAYPGRPSYAVSTFRSITQLCHISARIVDAFYSFNISEVAQSTLLRIRLEVREQLKQWKDNMPSWLQFDPSIHPVPPPHQVTPHTMYWTLVILTEQAFLNRGHFNFTLNEEMQQEARQMCIEAAINIWKIVEAYKKTFTLRRAQYGISHATYCAVLVMLQQTDLESDEYIECIRFFWTSLLEFQRDWNTGLKRPLRLLKSLMRRLERVAAHINVEETESTTVADFGDFQADVDALLGPNAFPQGQVDLWDSNAWFNAGPDDCNIADDTIFGIADESISGIFM